MAPLELTLKPVGRECATLRTVPFAYSRENCLRRPVPAPPGPGHKNGPDSRGTVPGDSPRGICYSSYGPDSFTNRNSVLPVPSMVVPLPPTPDLTECLLRLVCQIPPGQVATFGDLADALGNPVAARWTGRTAAEQASSETCPWHRLVRADGSLSPLPARADTLRRRRLAQEGVAIREGRVELAQFRFRGFRSDRPLAQLRAVQEQLARKLKRSPRKRIPELVAGVDVAYPDSTWAQAAYALVEAESGRLVWSETIRRRVDFPYITSYLSFRELPILLALLDTVREVGKLAEVVVVDGSGILHPSGAGIAAHLGVVASLPTIGVTKKLLCGSVAVEGMRPGEARPVLVEGRPAGLALRPTSGTRRPIFISPGHRVDLAYCERVVRTLMFGRRLPAPVYWADRLTRAR